MGADVRPAHATVTSGTHVANIRLCSTQAQVNSPALRSWKLLIGRLLTSCSLKCSLWWFRRLFCGAAQPSRVAPRKCMDLSVKWIAFPLLPPDSNVLSLLQHSHCLTQLQRGNMRMGSVALHFLSFPSLPQNEMLALSAASEDARSCFTPSLFFFLCAELNCRMSHHLLFIVSQLIPLAFPSLSIDLEICVFACAASSGRVVQSELHFLHRT